MKQLITVFVIAFGVLIGNTAFANQPAALDGKTFTGEVGDKGKAGDPDKFIFTNGKFHSTACDQYGYTDAPYTAISKDGKTTFTSITKNKDGDTITWNGTVTKNSIDGAAVRVSKGNPPSDMWFKGTLKN